MTINFAKLGNARKDGTYQVYLRYQYKRLVDIHRHVPGNTKYEYIPTGEYLSEPDIEKLLADKLSGKVYVKLHQFKSVIEQYVNGVFESTRRYPTKDQIESLRRKRAVNTSKDYIKLYMLQLKPNVKSTTFNTHSETVDNIMLLIDRLSKDNKMDYLNPVLFATKETTADMFNEFISKNYANGYIRTSILLLLRIQNFIRKELGLDPIVYKLDLKSTYKQFELSEKELNTIINWKTDNKNYQLAQKIVRLNKVVGLRIDEILNVHAEDISIRPDHILVQIQETKKNKAREVITVDYELMNLLKELKDQVVSGRLFHTTKDNFNYYLKRIALYSGEFNDTVLLVKNVGKEMITTRLKRHEVISSHNIRAFAITKNAKEYGILAASYFSGHSDLRTMEKHYLGKIKTEDILQTLKQSRGYKRKK